MTIKGLINLFIDQLADQLADQFIDCLSNLTVLGLNELSKHVERIKQ